MTNAVRSFKMEMSDAERVVDVYSAIAAKSATNVTELAEAMSKTASSAESVGSSFENTTAMMAVMIEATREAPQNIGSALKSIISRYGELKTNPNTLVDSEGEELSLNKVDTALQSVGISIHNAQGQFRDFDDVIMELAQAWDTIDVNTQRYIATIMAGNRQQSRFLALVSNYERYSELSETAANAANASQLQFLKTLDSIEAKTQQLQTSLQSLYTSSGLEDFYKGILDITNNIISSFTSMPTMFNLPIAAIAKFGASFWSLAQIVKSVFALLINTITDFKLRSVNATTSEISQRKNQYSGFLSWFKNHLAQVEKAEKDSQKRRLTAAQAFNDANKDSIESGEIENESGKSRIENRVGLELNTAALIANLAGAALKSSNNLGTRRAGGGISALGSAASGAAMGVAGGLPGMAAGAMAGGALGFIQNFNDIIQPLEYELKVLKETADEAKNKALQEQAEAKALQSATENVKKLKDAQYQSAEAQQAYLEASNTMAQQYPELISYYDEAGNAIIDLDAATQKLTESLKNTKDVTIASAVANYKYNKKQEEKTAQETGEKQVNSMFEATNLVLGMLGYSKDEQQLGIENLRGFDSETLQDVASQSRSYEGYNTLIENEVYLDFIKQTNESLSGWLENQKNAITVLKGSSDSALSNFGAMLEEIAKSYGIYLGELENSARTTANTLKSNILSIVDLDYNSNKELKESVSEIAGGYELLQQYAIKSVSYSEGMTNEELDKALQDLDLSRLWDNIKEFVPNNKQLEKMLSDRGKISKTAFKAKYGELLEEINDPKFNEALLEPYKNAYDITKFTKFVNGLTTENDNSLQPIQKVLNNINSELLESLSGAELESIVRYTNQVIELIQSGKLTTLQGTNLLSQYGNLQEAIGKLDDEQREIAQAIFSSWDGTREGLESLKQSLIDSGVSKDNKVFNEIDNLSKLISQNLNTTFQALSTSIASSVKNIDDAVKDLSKGVSIDKAVEYANKLGIDLTEFELDYSSGLYKIKDNQIIYNKYFENIDKQLEEANAILANYTNENNQGSINSLIQLRKTQEWSEISNEEFDKIQGLDRGQVQAAIDGFLTEVGKTGNESLTFLEYLKSNYQELSNTLSEAKVNAQARAALSLGDISGFIDKIIGENGFINSYIRDSIIANGKININDIKARAAEDGIYITPEIEQLLKLYIPAAASAFKDITKNIYDEAINSITNGATTVKVTQGNKAALTAIGAKFFNDNDGIEQALIDWSDTTIGNYQDRVKDILLSGLKPEDIDAQLEALEKAVYNNGVSEAFDSIISNYNGFNAATANKLANALGKTIEELNLSFEKITGEYSIGLQELRKLVTEASDEIITPKDRNAALAKIDKEIRETSVQNTFSELAKNASNLSEDQIRAFADSTGQAYQTLATLWKQDDGTYKVDLKRLVAMKQSLSEAGNEFAVGVLDSVIDEYLNQLSNISSQQTSGYTNISDMRAIADKFANGNLGIFEWDKELRAYTLSNAGIMQQAKAAADQLKSLDENSEEYKKAWQLMKADGQALADNIDFIGLIGAIGSQQYDEAAEKFTKAVENYNYYLIGSGLELGLSAEKLIKLAKQGGLSAVKAAQYIAEQAGKKLEGSDIETIYRSGATRINTALEQVNLSVGSVIDDTTVQLLGIQNQVTDLGSGKYVINSAIDLVEAHKQLLRAMYKDNTYTLAELNALQAKVLAGNEQADLLDSISNISELTYDTLGKIAEQTGVTLFEFYNTLEKNNAIQKLGGGKLRITNFDYFADLIGLTDRSSEAYIETLSKYNDEVINYNRSRADAVISELKAVSEAKAGDQINITKLWGGLSEGLQNSLKLLLAGVGAQLDNGILNVNNANIAQVIGILRDAASNLSDLAERDKAEIEDAFANLLQRITESIKNGLQGNLSNVGKLDLIEGLKNYGITMKDTDFTKTAEGWQLSADAAFKVVEAMQQIDAIQGNLVLKELRDSLKEAQFELTDLYSYGSSLGYKVKSGNVDLISHSKHQITGKQMREAGYKEFKDDEYATLYSQTRTSDEFEKDVPILLNITPISNDGKTITSPEDLDAYVKDLFNKGKTASEILELDKKMKGLVISAEDVESFNKMPEAIAKAKSEMEALHNQSDNLASKWKEISEINLMEATSKNDALDFMNNKLPDALENPLTYAENWGKAINILKKGSGDKKGFIDARDWYNIVNEMNHIAGMGENIKMYGVELDGSLEAASELIQKGYNALKSIDGGKMQVDLSQLGVSFEQGAMDMKGSVTEGIHAMAQSQIDMLDGLIAVLETIVAMQDAFAGLKASDDGKLDFGELFTFGEDWEGQKGWIATDDFKKAAERLTEQAKNSEELKKALEQVKINGDSLSALYDQAAQGYKFSKDKAEALAAATNAFYQASLSGNYDLNNIYDSVKEVLQQSGIMDGKLSIDIGTTTLYLTGNVITSIDWGSKKVKDALKDAYKGKKKDGKTPREQAEAAIQEFQEKPQNLLGEGHEADLKFILQTNTDVTYDDKKKTYTVDGHAFTDEKEAYKALLLKQTSKQTKLTFDDDGKLTGGVIEGKEGVKVTMTLDSQGNIEYTYIGPTGETSRGDTPQNAIRAYYMAHPNLLPENMSLDDIVHNETVKLGLESSTGITFSGKDQNGNESKKPTLTQSKMAQDLLNDPNIKTYEELRTYANEHPELGLSVDSSLTGDLSIDDLNKIAELFGVDYKMEAKDVALNVTTEDVPQPLKDLLTNPEGATAKLKLELDSSGLLAGDNPTGTDENGGLNIGDLPVTANLIVTPTGVQLAPAEGEGEKYPVKNPIPGKGTLEFTPDAYDIKPPEGEIVPNIQNILTDDKLPTNKKVTLLLDLLGYEMNSGNGEGEGGENQEATLSDTSSIPDKLQTNKDVELEVNNGGYTLAQGEGEGNSTETGAALVGEVSLPDILSTGGSVKLGVGSDGFVLSTGGPESEGVQNADFLNTQLTDWASGLMFGEGGVDTQKSVDLLVGVKEFLTKPNEGKVPLTVSEEIQTAIANAGKTTEQQMTLGVVVSKILAGGATGEGTEGGTVGTPDVELSAAVLAILNSPYMPPDKKLDLLLTLGAIKTQAGEETGEVDFKDVLVGVTEGADGGWTFEQLMSLMLSVTKIDSQNDSGETPTGDSIATNLGIQNEYTASARTLTVPIEKIFVDKDGNPIDPTNSDTWEWSNPAGEATEQPDVGLYGGADVMGARGGYSRRGYPYGGYPYGYQTPPNGMGNYGAQHAGPYIINGNEPFSARRFPDNPLPEYASAAGQINANDINNVQQLCAVLQLLAGIQLTGDMASSLETMSASLTSISETATPEMQGSLTSVQEGLANLTTIEPAGIESCVTAMQSLLEKAQSLQVFDWADLRTKLNQLFGGGGNGNENGDNTNNNLTGLNNLTVNIGANYLDTYLQELMTNQNITRTITVNIKKGTDETNGGPTDGETDQTDNSGDSGKTTVNDQVTNQELNATASLDTSSLEQSLNTLSQAMDSIPKNKDKDVSDFAKAMNQVPDDKDDVVKDLASAMQKIPDDKDENINHLVAAINKIPDKTVIEITANLTAYFKGEMEDIDVNVTVNVSPGGGGGGAGGNISGGGTYKAGTIKLDHISPESMKGTIPIAPMGNNALAIGGSGKKGGSSNGSTKGGNGSGGSGGRKAGAAGNIHAMSHGNLNRALVGGTRKTLMGELGPELYVTNGGYYLAGENGTEFVNLPRDAIVFNHIDTKRLMKQGFINGHGKPITNERNAVSFAKGTPPQGPAQASAAAALAALKQLRAMWQSMLNASAQDLGSQAGKGGGGGKGGAEKDDKGKQIATVTEEIQRWYNLIRKIEKCEENITLYEKQQAVLESDRIANGEEIYKKQKQQLEVLKQEIKYNQELAKLQKSWYEKKAEEYAKSDYSKIYTFNTNTGLLQYAGSGKPGSKKGLDILEQLSSRDANNVPTGHAANAEEQLKYLKSVGFNIAQLLNNGDGTKVAKAINTSTLKITFNEEDIDDEGKPTKDKADVYVEMMQNFWDGVDNWREELDSVWKSYNDQLNKIEDNQKKANDILQAFIDNEIDVENKLLEAVEAREQAVIDKLQEQKDALEKSTEKFITGLKESLDKEKEAQQDNKSQEELTKLQRQLAILQRSGGSASQIKSLQNQIASKQQDMYYDSRQKEIEAIQEASDKQLEKLDKQIEILTETLEYQKKNGLFWNEIRDLMQQSEQVVTAFYNQYVTSISGKSALQQEEDLREFTQAFQEWIGYRDDKNQQSATETAVNAAINEIKQTPEIQDALNKFTDNERSTFEEKATQAAEEAYTAHLNKNPGDEEGARQAAQSAYTNSLKQSYIHDSESGVNAGTNFDNYYKQWIKNRRVSNKNDFTNTDTFKNNEAAFQSAMKDYYLEHRDDNISKEQLWKQSIDAGESKLKAIQAQAETDSKNATTFKKKAYMYKVDKGKKMKKTKTTYPKNGQAIFDKAAVKKVDGKDKKMLHMKGKSAKTGWFLASDVAGGGTKFNKLTTATELKANAGNINNLSNIINTGIGNKENANSAYGYYGSPNAANNFVVTGLKKAALKFPTSQLEEKNTHKYFAPSAKSNQIQVTDIKGLQTTDKGNVKKFTKLKVNALKRSSDKGLRTLASPQWITYTDALKKRINKAISSNKKIRDILAYMNSYKEGGIIDYTGLANVHGSKNKPESVLNAQQTEFLKKDLLGNSNNSLMSIVQALQASIDRQAVGNPAIANNDDHVVFENVEVTFEAGTISSDYDMKRASEMFKDELVKMARKSGSRSVARR